MIFVENDFKLCYIDGEDFIEFNPSCSLSVDPFSRKIRRFYLVANYDITEEVLEILVSLNGTQKKNYAVKVLAGNFYSTEDDFKNASHCFFKHISLLDKKDSNIIPIDIMLESFSITSSVQRLDITLKLGFPEEDIPTIGCIGATDTAVVRFDELTPVTININGEVFHSQSQIFPQGNGLLPPYPGYEGRLEIRAKITQPMSGVWDILQFTSISGEPFNIKIEAFDFFDETDSPYAFYNKIPQQNSSLKYINTNYDGFAESVEFCVQAFESECYDFGKVDWPSLESSSNMVFSTKGFDIENPDTNLNIYSYELDNYFNIFIDGEQTTFEDIAYTSFFYGSEVHKERKRYMSKNGLGPGVYLPRSVDNCFFTFVALDSTATVKICSKVPTATYGGMIEGADYPKSFGSIWTQDFFLEGPRFYYADHLYTINEDGFEALEFKINPTVFQGVTDFTTYCEDSIDSTRVYFTFNNSSVLANVPANEYLATIVVDEVPYAFYMPEGGYDGTHFFNMLSQYIEQTNMYFPASFWSNADPTDNCYLNYEGLRTRVLIRSPYLDSMGFELSSYNEDSINSKIHMSFDELYFCIGSEDLPCNDSFYMQSDFEMNDYDFSTIAIGSPIGYLEVNSETLELFMPSTYKVGDNFFELLRKQDVYIPERFGSFSGLGNKGFCFHFDGLIKIRIRSPYMKDLGLRYESQEPLVVKNSTVSICVGTNDTSRLEHSEFKEFNFKYSGMEGPPPVDHIFTLNNEDFPTSTSLDLGQDLLRLYGGSLDENGVYVKGPLQEMGIEPFSYRGENTFRSLDNDTKFVRFDILFEDFLPLQYITPNNPTFRRVGTTVQFYMKGV